MTPREKTVLRAIIKALHVKRNRFGKLEDYENASNDQQAFASSFPLPHGGADRIDQAVMILQAMVGDPIKSIMD